MDNGQVPFVHSHAGPSSASPQLQRPTPELLGDRGFPRSQGLWGFPASEPPLPAGGPIGFTPSVVQAVPRRWGRPAPSPAPPPSLHQDAHVSNMNYLQAIQGLQTGFYNPHSRSNFYPHQGHTRNLQGDEPRTRMGELSEGEGHQTDAW